MTAARDVGAYRKLLDHGASCTACRTGMCPAARRLWRVVTGRETRAGE